MYLARITGAVRKELITLGINGEIRVLKIKEEYCLLRVIKEEKNYFVKYFDGKGCKKEIENHLLMEKYGINVLKMIGNTDKVIVYEDKEEYRECSINDLKRKEIIIKLAREYKKMSEINGEGLENYYKYFNKYNLVKIMEKYNFFSNRTMCYIYNNFDNIYLKFSRVKQSVIYGCFCLDNVMVSDYSDDIYMVNFSELQQGLRYEDIVSVCDCLDEEYKDIFIKEIGEVKEEEISVYEVVNCVIKLYFTTIKKDFYELGAKEVRKVNNGVLLKNAQYLVEWC